MAHSGDRSGFGVAHDFISGGKEKESDFPILCQTCLGESPYVRMQRDNMGKECNICNRVYTGFRWKPGPKARYKLTVICQTCARLKNVCQTCIFDLEYGLPVQVRDKVLSGGAIALPEHSVNREYMMGRLESSERGLEEITSIYGRDEAAHSRLKALARTAPYYQRNLPRVCSFWRKGECKRGDECPYLHAEVHSDADLGAQTMRDRYVGQSDPVAEKIWRMEASGNYKNNNSEPPEDKTITTLFLAGVTPQVTESCIRDIFQTYGEIVSVRIGQTLPDSNRSANTTPRGFAFVCFATRQSAEHAVQKCGRFIHINDVRLRVLWAKPKAPRPEIIPALPAEANKGPVLPPNNGIMYLPPPMPGLPPIPVSVPVPPPAPTDPSTAPEMIYSSMRPQEAELARQ